jgi:hypothetical protein
VFLYLFISIQYAQGEFRPKGREFQIGARHAIFQGMDKTVIEGLARPVGTGYVEARWCA